LQSGVAFAVTVAVAVAVAVAVDMAGNHPSSELKEKKREKN